MPVGASRARRWVPVWIALFFGAALTVIYYERERAQEGERVSRVVNVRADWRAVATKTGIRPSLAMIESTAAFVASNPGMTGDLFRDFVQSLHSYHEVHPQRVMWLPKVAEEEREAFEAKVRAGSGPADFKIMDVGPNLTLAPRAARPHYFPVLYAVLSKGGQPFLGVDPFSDPERLGALVVARDSGDTGMTIARPSEGSDDVGPVVSVYAPVYAGGRVPGMIEERRAALVGIVSGVFSVLDLLNTANVVPDSAADIFVSERPFTRESPVMPMAVSPSSLDRFVEARAPLDVRSLSGEVIERVMQLGGQQWYLLFHYSPAQLDLLRSAEATLILVVGTLLTLAVAGYAATQRHVVESLVSGIGIKDRQLREASADLARSNAWLLAAIEASPVAMIGIDTEGHVMSWNDSATAIFGYSAGEALGRFPPNVPAEREDESRNLMTRVLAGETLRNFPVTARTKDGRSLEILASAAPIRATDGRVSGLVAMMVDTTDLRQAERALSQSVKMEALGQLTGGLAHDLNNLLGVIVGNLDLLQDKIADRADLQKFVTTPLNAALKGAELNNALLAFSQRQDLEPSKLSVATVVADMAKMLGRTLGDNITLKVDTPPDLWPIVADQAQLASAILHLAVNARDAMPSGGRLTITAANVAVDAKMRQKASELAQERYVCLSVTDTGTGMTPEVIAHVFEPFFTTKRDRKGSGLGLPQVLGFAKQSGGTARIYSEVGHGTSVHLYLPAAGDDEAAGLSAAMDLAFSPGRGETILVVEDNPELRDAVVAQLDSLGYRPVVAADGREALEELTKGIRADLLFTDVVMPGGMDGRQLAAEVKARWPGMKMLFTSGFAGASAADGGALPGRLLRKPYRMQDLAARIRETLDS